MAGWAQADVRFTLSSTDYPYTGDPIGVTITGVETTENGTSWTPAGEEFTVLYYSNEETGALVYGPSEEPIGTPSLPGTYWVRVRVGDVTSSEAASYTISAPAAPVISLEEDVTDYNGSNTTQPTIVYSGDVPANPVYSITFTPYHGNTATALEAEALTSLAQIRNAGTYAIKVREGEYGNWSNTVTYTVNPAQLLLMVTTTQQPYGSAASDDIIKYAITGTLKQGDVTTRLMVDGLHFLTVGDPTTAVGTSYTYSITTDDAWATIKLSSTAEIAYENYVPYVTNQATVTIVKAPITLTVDAPAAITFGDPTPNFTASVTAGAVKEGETLNYTITPVNTDELTWPHVGTYTLALTVDPDEGDNKNYNITCVNYTVVEEVQVPTTITVNKKQLAPADFTISGIEQEYTYKRAAWEPEPTSVVAAGFTLTADDYSLSYDNNINASTDEAKAKVIIELAATGNFEYANDEKASQEFTINPRSVADCFENSGAFGAKYYTGQQITANAGNRLYWPTKDTAGRLTANTDFTYEWGENVEVGENAGSITFTGIGNWTGTKTVTFDILARPVVTEETPYAGLAFGDYDPEPYTGVQIKPETTGKVTFAVGTADPVALVEGTDYTVEYGDNIAVGETSGSVIYTFIKNFSGSYTKNFEITPAGLIITANDVNVNYGTGVPAFTVTYSGFISPENENTEGIFTGTLAFDVKAENTAEAPAVDSYASVGTYYIWPKGLESANYAITFKSGKLTVAAPQLTIVSNDAEKTYGDADPDEFTYKIVDGLGNEVTTISFDGGVGYTAPTLTRVAGEDVNADGYVITPSGAAHPNYTFTYAATGKLTIKPRPIQVNVKPQTIDYGADIEKTSTAGTIWTFDTDVTPDWNGNTNDAKADLNLVLSTVNAIDTYAPGSTTANAIKATISNTNYVLTNTAEQWGTLIINEVSEIVLDPTQDMENDINNFNGKTVKVKFANMTMNAKEWYAIVLPFATTPAELVKGLGMYVVCNHLDTENSTDQNYKFKLEMDELPAGVPFLIKPAQNLNWADFDLGMEVGGTAEEPSDPVAVKKTIVSAITPSVAYLDDKELVSFTGTYADDEILGVPGKPSAEAATILGECWWLSDTNYEASKIANDWRKPKNNAHALKSMEAYLLAGEGWTTYAPSFTVEDFDGQVTTITTLNAESNNSMTNEGWYTLNGIKLESAPTQKGIYIKDGKKVVIR